MTMTPDRFRELLDAGTADAPPGPLPSEDLAAGRAQLRRRRAVLASAVASAVVVAAAIGGGAYLGGDDRAVEPVAPSVPQGPSKAEVDRLVAACQDEMPDNLLRGPVHVMTTAASAFRVEAVFVSEQERYWAACSIDVVTPGAGPEVVAFDSQASGESGFGLSIGPVCAEQVGCRLVGVSFSDRRDPAVAAMRVELADGSAVTLETPDGFLAFSAVEVLPDGASFGDSGLVADYSGLSLLHQVTFLDDSGTPIAGTVYDGTGGGRFRNEVAGLPSLDRYPSLMGSL